MQLALEMSSDRAPVVNVIQTMGASIVRISSINQISSQIEFIVKFSFEVVCVVVALIKLVFQLSAIMRPHKIERS